MAYYRFVATALLLRQCQWWHKMQSRQQQHSQPACPSSFLSTYHEQAGQGCRWCRIEPPMTLIGCLLAVAADSDGEGSAAASNETLATVFTQVWPYIVALFDFLCSNHRISHGLLTRLHNSSSGGATWPHSWLQFTSPLRIPCTSTVPSIMRPPRPTWLLHVTLPSHGQPALPRPHAAPLQKALTRPACSTSPLAPHPHVAPAQKHCSRLQPSAHLPHVPPAPALDPQPQMDDLTIPYLISDGLAGTNKHRPSVAKMFTE
ncbi:uncharacterized protein [Miscanthus floridulus]|uniref:uncharacterized protein isoform X2 n=1 Tax=Miscanthus floridulus TaxID=154761 RepID=UPI00345B1688